jgi:hypothetical protein
VQQVLYSTNTWLPISRFGQEENLAGEPEVQQKPDVWKKVVILGAAVIGGLAGWRFAGTFHPGFDIIVGIFVGAAVASMVWDFSNEKSR